MCHQCHYEDESKSMSKTDEKQLKRLIEAAVAVGFAMASGGDKGGLVKMQLQNKGGTYVLLLLRPDSNCKTLTAVLRHQESGLELMNSVLVDTAIPAAVARIADDCYSRGRIALKNEIAQARILLASLTGGG